MRITCSQFSSLLHVILFFVLAFSHSTLLCLWLLRSLFSLKMIVSFLLDFDLFIPVSHSLPLSLCSPPLSLSPLSHFILRLNRHICILMHSHVLELALYSLGAFPCESLTGLYGFLSLPGRCTDERSCVQ